VTNNEFGNYSIVEAEWPERESATKKALREFIASGLRSGEIKGNKDFLVNVRRAARTHDEFRQLVELRMVDGRMYVRRKDTTE